MTVSIIILGVIAVVSVSFNIALVWYAKVSLKKVNTIYAASEQTAEIFSMMDIYTEHLQSVYEMPLFYGDETLQSLLGHSKEMLDYLKKYEKVYSFTQPDLEDQLQAASKDLENYEEDAEET